MKFLVNSFFVFVCLVLFTDGVFGARKTTSRAVSKSTSATNVEEIKEDCATKYIAAIDKECYNSGSDFGGVYADCRDKTSNDFYDIMDMQLARVVDSDKFADYVKKCQPYKGYALEKWVTVKSVIEKSAVKDSPECTLAMNKLAAAKKCYSAALAHDGNFFNYSDIIKQNCGNQAEVSQKFIKAGDLGLANLPKMLENYSTLQFTTKSENWRGAVEAVLSGYIYTARQTCGNESYDIIQLNQFAPDSRTNLLTTASEGFADEFGSQMGNRAWNSGAYKPLSKPGEPTYAVNVRTKTGSAVDKFYSEGTSWDGSKNVYVHYVDEKTNPVAKSTYSIRDIYVIENVSSVNSARARLLNILKTGDVSDIENQDNIDASIILGLGGRIGVGVGGVVSNIRNGDTFLIRQNTGLCQVLIYKDGNLNKVPTRDVDNLPELYGYVSGCADLLE